MDSCRLPYIAFLWVDWCWLGLNIGLDKIARCARWDELSSPLQVRTYAMKNRDRTISCGAGLSAIFNPFGFLRKARSSAGELFRTQPSPKAEAPNLRIISCAF